MTDHEQDATVETITSRLLADPDAARRYRVIQDLEGGALRDVRAVSLRQLRVELGSTTAAAEAVGISRQAANEMLGKAGSPGARGDRQLTDRPGYKYGQWLGAVTAFGASLDRKDAAYRIEEKVKSGQPPQSVMPAVAGTVQRWLRDLRRHDPARAEQWEREIAERASALGEWSRQVGDRYLNEEEMGDLILGCAVARKEIRQRQL